MAARLRLAHLPSSSLFVRTSTQSLQSQAAQPVLWKGDTIIDYRSGDSAVVEGIKDGLKGATLHHAFDATAEKGSYLNILQILHSSGKLTTVLPLPEGVAPKTVSSSWTSVSDAHGKFENAEAENIKASMFGDLRDFAHVFFRYLARGLDQGWFKTHPYEVVPGGLDGLQHGLSNLKEGKASAIKYVFRIADTVGVKKV